AVHIALMEDEVVERRRWLTPARRISWRDGADGGHLPAGVLLRGEQRPDRSPIAPLSRRRGYSERRRGRVAGAHGGCGLGAGPGSAGGLAHESAGPFQRRDAVSC